MVNSELSGNLVDLSPVAELTDQMIELIFDNSDALACIINIRKKDDYLLEHSISVSILISILANYAGFEKSLVSQLAIGAFLHDVGKIMIPDQILNKTAGLSVNEFEIMKTHVSHSASIINQVQGISNISQQVVANHHEKLNGTGYPAQLAGDELDLYSRMITVCDIYDALTAQRAYKKGIAQITAFAILSEMAEKGELDKSIVNQLIKSLGVFPVGSLVRLSSNKLALVEKSNQSIPTRPVVKSFFSINQNVFVKARDIDLSHELDIYIEQAVKADDFDLDMEKITEFLLMEG